MNESYPLVSIVIPVYNGSNFLRDAIDSALAQTYENIEILVINDGSNDGGETESIAFSYGDKIRYFHKENGGVASALNFGIEKMEGEYFSWLSHDDLYLPEKIQSQIELLNSINSTESLVTCALILADENGVECDRYQPFYNYSEEQLSRPLFALFHGLIGGCCLLIHKSHFKRVGVFNTQLPTTQDYDLWFRMMRNENLYFTKEPLVKTRCHNNQDSKKLYNEHIIECDELWIKMINQLTEQEMCMLSGSVYRFYSDAYWFLSNMPYNGAATYAQALLVKVKIQMINALIQDDLPISRNDLDDLDYTSKDVQILLREMSLLLYKVSKNYDSVIAAKDNELGFYKTKADSMPPHQCISDMPEQTKGKLKRVLVRLIRFAYRCFTKIIVALGLKERCCRTKLFHKLRNKGYIERLSRK